MRGKRKKARLQGEPGLRQVKEQKPATSGRGYRRRRSGGECFYTNRLAQTEEAGAPREQFQKGTKEGREKGNPTRWGGAL